MASNRGRTCLLATLLLLGLVMGAAHAASAPAKSFVAHGKVGGKAPDWTIVSDLPTGWSADCCNHARWVGVPMLLYRGAWTGKPEGVIVLNVWPAAGKSLQRNLDADRKRYLQRDPKARVATLAYTAPKNMTCLGVLYRGSDHVDDAVVFCDPGKYTGIHYSWSISVAETDPARAQLLAHFDTVVARSVYMQFMSGSSKPGTSGKR